MHPRAFQACLHHELVATFYTARANGPAVLLIGRIVHQVTPLVQVGDLFLNQWIVLDQSTEMTQYSFGTIVFEAVEHSINPLGRQMPSRLAHLVCNLADVASRMGKIQNTHRIVAMTVDKPLNPLGSILESTDLLGSLDASSSHFCARLIGKGGRRSHACKVGELARHNRLFVLALAACNHANRD